MRSGELRHHLMLQRATTAQDAVGEAVETWRDVGPIWAKVSPASGSEQVVSLAPEARITHQVKTRFRDDVAPKMRLKWDARLLNIVAAIDPDERGKELLISCTEVL